MDFARYLTENQYSSNWMGVQQTMGPTAAAAPAPAATSSLVPTQIAGAALISVLVTFVLLSKWKV